VLGLIIYMLLLGTALYSMPVTVAALTILAADPFSKMVAGQLVAMLPYARREEDAKNKTVYRKPTVAAGITAMLLGLAPMVLMLWLTGINWYLVIAVPPLVMYFLYLLMLRKIQGYTGDCCGAVCLLVELAVYLTVCSQSLLVNS
jgi:adenosylcobinamide-GDP ribazoletransferase